MVDVTPMVAADRKVIQSYGKNGFKISNENFTGPILVFPSLVTAWDVPETPKDLEITHFAPLIGADDVDVVLFGGGEKAVFLPPDIREMLNAQGLAVESMDTGAACRTYNVLLAEERRIAAALYPTQ
tara:strand:- start:563 stop:943 length:381 start_codon:yes stop_codon:yes gene_type:complete